MGFRRIGYKRRPFRARRFRRRITKRRSSNVHFLKLRAAASVTTTAGGVLDDFISLSNPNAVINGSTALQDWSSVKEIWHQYKVNAVKVMFIPKYPNDTSTVTGYNALYIGVKNEDAGTAATGSGEIITKNRATVKNMYRPWTYYVKVNHSANSLRGYQDTSSTTNEGCIQTYATGLDVSDTYGTYLITYYMKMRSRH